MDPTEQANIERACEQLCIAYARSIDFRDYDNFVELFADDAVLDVGNPLHGQAAILESIRRRPDELRSRHVMTNLFVEVLNRDQARGMAYLSLYRHIGEESLLQEPVAFSAPAAVGHYEDRYVRTDAGWRFARRRLFLAFRNPDLVR